MVGIKGACGVILAAGEGKRMLSERCKVLLEVSYKPMLSWVTDAAAKAGVENICVVANSDEVIRLAEKSCGTVFQEHRLGTGHAVMCAADYIKSCAAGEVLVLCGDAPFIDCATISAAYEKHMTDGNAVTVISAEVENPDGYGRIVRSNGGLSIVEHRDADEKTKAVHEINSGCYWFNADALLSVLGELSSGNKQGEYYLTDTVKLLGERGKRCGCFFCDNPDIVLGANTRADLLYLNELASKRAIERCLERGVSFVSRDGIIISPDAEIEPEAEILPGTVIKGRCHIGARAVIGPNSVLENTDVGAGTLFNASQAEDACVGAGCRIGPWVHLRPGSSIADGVKLGNFVEIKNSVIGEGTSVAHLTYLGDCDVGRHVNFGCGVVMVNYDGEKKSRSTVGDFAFIGCNTNIVSPVNIGKNAYTGAGTTVTKDVPDGALAVGRPETVIKEGWGERKQRPRIEKHSK